MRRIIKQLADMLGKAAESEFRKSQTGRALSDLVARAKRGRIPAPELNRLSKRLSPAATQGMARQILNQLGLETPQTKSPGGFFRELSEALGPIVPLLRSFASPRVTGKRVSRSREIAAARDLLGAFGHVVVEKTQATSKQAREVADYLRGLGFTVSEPEATEAKPETGERITPVSKPTDDLVSGEMIEVQSSNVHSIGFVFERDRNGRLPQLGILRIRFLQKTAGRKSGPGPQYEYFNVPTRVFQAFRAAASKGKFIWDRIRIRNTVSGSRFDYRLQGITNGYVPRKATLIGSEEWFIGRTFRGERNGEQRVFHSQKPNERARFVGGERGSNVGTR